MKDLFSKVLYPAVVSGIAVFAPIKGTLITIGIVIGVDFITGILAAKKRGEAIKSAAARRTVSKLLIYQTAILTGFLIEKFLMNSTIPITSLVSAIIGSVETLSIYENLNTLSGNNLFKGLIGILGSANDRQVKTQETEIVDRLKTEVGAPSDTPKE